MIPYLLAAVGGYLIGQSQKKDVPQMAKGGRILVGRFDENQLRNGEDKKAIEKKMKETGLKYIDSRIIKKNGKPHIMEVYLYADGGMMAKGGFVVKAWQTKNDYENGNAQEVGKFQNIQDAHLLVDDYLSPNKFEWYAAEIYDANDGETLYHSEDDGYTEMADGGEIYSLAENMTDAEYEKKLSSLNKKQKNKYDSLVSLGDSPKLALATVLLNKEVKWDDVTIRAYTMAKGGKIPEKEIESLKKNVFKWYGKDGMTANDEDAEFVPPVTEEEIEVAVKEYVKYCNREGVDKWGGGDSFDREVIVDIMLYNRNPENESYFYPTLLKEIKSTTDLPPIYAKGGKVKSKKWIQEALTGDEGSLRRTAKRKGLLRGDENLSMTDLKKLQKMGGKTGKRAHLAETLRKFDDGGMIDKKIESLEIALNNPNLSPKTKRQIKMKLNEMKAFKEGRYSDVSKYGKFEDGGMMADDYAEGGVLAHGLREDDKIYVERGNLAGIKNHKTDEKFIVDISTGSREKLKD